MQSLESVFRKINMFRYFFKLRLLFMINWYKHNELIALHGLLYTTFKVYYIFIFILVTVNVYVTIFHVFISGYFFQFLGTSLSLFEWCMCMTKDITCIVCVTHRTCVCCDDIYDRRNPMWYRRFMIIIIWYKWNHS